MAKKKKDFEKKKLVVGKPKEDKLKVKKQTIKLQSQTFEKDILLNLKSSNVQLKIEAINQLCSLPLKKVIDLMGEILSENSDKTRLKLLEFSRKYFASVSSTDILPFFSTLLVFTQRALTNINQKIRTSAVDFVAVLLERYPMLIKEFPNSFISSFLDVLGCSPGKSSQGFTQFKVQNAENSVGLLNSRDKVLDCFHLFLSLNLQNQTKEQHDNLVISYL
jgi:hypothetical protein